MGDPRPTAYADCIDYPCPRCHAEPGHWCINPISRLPSAIGCAERYRVAKHPIERENQQ